MLKDKAGIDTECLNIITNLETLEKNNSIKILSRKDELMRVKLNIHNGKVEVKNLQEYLLEKRKVLKKADVTQYVNKRIDICIDSFKNFEENKKISNIIIGLFAIELKEIQVLETKNLFDQKTRSYLLKNRNIELCIYDKHKVEPSYEYNTRTEIRVKRVSKLNELETLKAVEIKLKNSLNHFEKLEELYVKIICERIEKAKKENKYSNFKAFVNYNHELFLTKRVFDGVFDYIRMKQTKNKWLENYRKESSLDFESKASVTKYLKSILKAMVEFRGNYKDWDRINKARKG